MKSFFDYFKGREAVEKKGNRASNPEKSISTSPTMEDDASMFPSGTRPSVNRFGSSIALSGKPSIDGGKSPEEQAIILELGDFLKRIPEEFLRPGDHQPARELQFGIDEVANNIAQGKATIPLSEIVKQCPEIFKDSIAGRDQIEIFFPWQKLARQVEVLRSGRSRTKPGAETLGSFATNQENLPTWSGKSQSGSVPVPQELRVAMSPGEGEAMQPKTRIEELLTERENILVELANTRSELERVRIEAARSPAVNASREGAGKQVESLNCQLQGAMALNQGLDERFEESEEEANTVELLRKELQAALEGRQHAVKALDLVRAEMQALRETNAEARTELVAHAAEIEKTKGAAEARVRELEQHIVDLSSKLELLALEREAPPGDSTQFRGHHAKLIASLKSERDSAFRSRDELQEEIKSIREAFRRKVETLTAERDALKQEKLQFNAQIDQLRVNHKKQIDFLNCDTEKRVAAMKRRVDAANTEREKLVWELKNQREQFNAEVEELRFERIALVRARDEAIAQERETRSELEDKLETFHREREPGATD